MKTTVVNKHHKIPYDVYIGRGSIWGNPFSHLDNTKAQFKVSSREEAVEKYREWILTQPHLLNRLHEIEGKVLCCYCKPKACHGDILIELIEERRNMGKALFQIYSDGASFNNGYKDPDLPQFSAAGIVITLNEKILFKGAKPYDGDEATISFTELSAAILVLDKLKEKIENLSVPLSKPYKVELRSDSQYVIKSVNEWMAGWIKRGWKNNEKKPVAQVDQWKDLKKRYLDNPDWDITWIHVKGHTKNKDFHSLMNKLCDEIASDRVKRMKEEKGL